ncbi:hypothetical protein ACHAP5_002064 [Fusarium lateritium]
MPDFDEDISDFDETKQDETIAYNGPDAVHYHQLREKREERKWEFHWRKGVIRKRTEDAREEEVKKQQEGRVAYDALEISLSSDATSELGPMDSQFDLYCPDYFDNFYDVRSHDSYRPYVKFQYREGQGAGNNALVGRVWLRPGVDYELAPLEPLQRASLKHHKRHIILRTSRDFVFMDRPHDAQVPDTFVFMGFHNDVKKELQSLDKSFEAATANAMNDAR